MISYYHFQLPLRIPFRTGGGDFSFREGVIIHFHDGKLDVLAEASPLPGFSKESIESVKNHLLGAKSTINAFLLTRFTLEELREFLSSRNDVPSIQFAISDLGRKILQCRGDLPEIHPLVRLQNKSVLVNDIVGYHIPENIKKHISSALDIGFKTIKIKSPTPDPKLADVLSEVANQHKDVKFRLDANQNWDMGKLKTFNAHFKNLPIEYIEEPFAMIHHEDITRASSISDYPIALDESIIDKNHLEKILGQHPDLYVIIKPMLLGNIFELLETISEHRSSYERVVVTSSLESEVGLESVSILAASMGDHKRAHGLNTGKLFRKNLVTKIEISRGLLHLSGQLESPITLDQIDPSMLKLL